MRIWSPRGRPLGVLLASVVLAAACGGGTGSGGAGASPGSGGTGPRTIAVSANDSMRFDPSAISARPGETVRFAVTNAGAIAHEFYLGTEPEQLEHEREMLSGQAHTHGNGLTVKPGETRQLDYTFETAGEVVAGCHIPGHYPAGMRAVITVSP